MPKFLICKHCGNLVEIITDKNVPIMCCGEKMAEIVANTEEASTEKHIPVVEKNNKEVTISVGSTIHPMEENHYIEWIYMKTNKCSYRFDLKPGDIPVVKVVLTDTEEVIEVYSYCNIHGLWKSN